MDPSGSAPAPSSSTFPQSPDRFDDDPRISYSKLDQTWILETDDGTEFAYDQALKRWIPAMDEALLEQQREAYAVTGVDETQPAPDGRQRKKRHASADDERHGSGPGAKKTKLGSDPPPARKNTAVYVTNLPPDTTVDEVRRVFSRCGVIAEEIDEGRPRIKLYTDAAGRFKGDALVVYFRAESVDLATQMLDEADFRLGEAGTSGPMKVQAADFSYKSQKEVPSKTNVREKKKVLKKTQKMNNKLADWDDDDPATIHDTSARWDKVVIMKHLFTLQELEEDPAAMLDIKEDIREECAKLGEVTNVVLFDREEDGVASVRFSTPEAARACVRLMDGRLFAGARVEAYIADGSEKFKKTTEKKTAVLEEDESKEEDQRLDQFGNWLEQGA